MVDGSLAKVITNEAVLPPARARARAGRVTLYWGYPQYVGDWMPMNLAEPFEVVTPTVDGAVLAVVGGANSAFTGRQVHRLAGHHSESGIRRALERLVAQGVIDSQRVGASTQYRLNRDHLAAPAIEALANLRSELLERLRNELGSWATPAEFVSLFGSAARGTMRVDSDIDLFVVRSDDVDADDPTWQGQTARLVSLVTRWTGNDARIFELGGSEVATGLADEEPVLADIRDQGIPLDGPPSYLRRLARIATNRE